MRVSESSRGLSEVSLFSLSSSKCFETQNPAENQEEKVLVGIINFLRSIIKKNCEEEESFYLYWFEDKFEQLFMVMAVSYGCVAFHFTSLVKRLRAQAYEKELIKVYLADWRSRFYGF